MTTRFSCSADAAEDAAGDEAKVPGLSAAGVMPGCPCAGVQATNSVPSPTNAATVQVPACMRVSILREAVGAPPFTISASSILPG